jgi:hypothetical protein
MLNPAQAGRLRKLIQSNVDVSYFEGFRIEHREIKLDADLHSVDTVLSEPSGNGLMYVPEGIFGTPYDSSCLNGIGNHTIHTTEKRLFKYNNATIVGYHGIIGDFGLGAPGPISSGFEFDQFYSQNQSNSHGFIINRESENSGAVAYFIAAETKNNIPGTGMFFHNLESGNYGSFLFRVLPQMLFVAENKDIKFDFYVTPGRTSWFLEAIRLVGLPNLPVFAANEITGDTVETLLVSDKIDNEGWIDSDTLRRVRGLAERALKADTLPSLKFGERLYVNRRLGGGYRPHYRRLVNELEVVALVEAHGFKTIYPETLCFVDQILAFSRAKAIIGPSGSGMLNAMFAQPGTRVLDMESFTHTVRQHAKIYSSTGKIFSFLFGKIPESPISPIFSNWSVEPHLIQHGIDWVIQNTK